MAARLRPGGVFALWSDDPPDDAFIAVMELAFESCRRARRHVPEPAHRRRVRVHGVRREHQRSAEFGGVACGADPEVAVLFRLNTPALVLFVSFVVLGATLVGYLLGRMLDRRREGFREPLGVTQGALVGFVALLLAFGLTMAVGRYEARRDAVVLEANAIGTTYLRAQTLAEPERNESLELLKQYTDQRIRLSRAVPESSSFDAASEASVELQNRLWGLAGDAMNDAPVDSAPRLYVETLNEMIDAHTVHVSALENRIPTSVLFLQLVATALALGVLAMYVAMLGRGVLTVFLAAAMITVVLLVMFDLDRPSRGLIRVPATPLVAERASMEEPPAAVAPNS